MANYEKTVWQAGDTVTAAKLNKIENQLEYVTENSAAIKSKRVELFNGTITIDRSGDSGGGTK